MLQVRYHKLTHLRSTLDAKLKSRQQQQHDHHHQQQLPEKHQKPNDANLISDESNSNSWEIGWTIVVITYNFLLYTEYWYQCDRE